MRKVTLAGMAMVPLLGMGTPLFVVNATAQQKDIGEFCGYVRQLDANASSSQLQAILNRTPSEQIVVATKDLLMRGLLQTAFVDKSRLLLSYRSGSPNVITRIKLSRWFNDSCAENPPDTK